MASKLMLITAGVEYCECDEECYCDPTIHTKELDVSDLVSDNQLQYVLVELIAKCIETKNVGVLTKLKQLGYVNVKEVEDRATKLEAEKKFWLINNGVQYYHPTVQELDLDNLTDPTLRTLAADDVRVTQTISKTSLKLLMSDEQKKLYDKEVAKKTTEKKKKAEAAKKQKETKRQKEIERAKKVLEEAGVAS